MNFKKIFLLNTIGIVFLVIFFVAIKAIKKDPNSSL